MNICQNLPSPGTEENVRAKTGFVLLFSQSSFFWGNLISRIEEKKIPFRKWFCCNDTKS